MKELNKKQKIILIIAGVILVIIVGVILFLLNKEERSTIDLNELLDSNNYIENQVEDVKPGENAINEKENKIIVHITGEVKKTGILTLPEGARIADAIKEAGGATNQADLDEINLAYELSDGQKIYIPNKKDKEKNEGKVYITSESGNNDVTENNNNSQGGNKKVNINEAGQSELETLPGIGQAMASRIIEYREQNGKFQKIEDIKNVKGIGDSKYNNIKEYITIK